MGKQHLVGSNSKQTKISVWTFGAGVENFRSDFDIERKFYWVIFLS